MWTAGVLAGITGRTVAGIVLRSAGIVLLGTTALRKSSLTMWTLLAVLAGVETGTDAPQMAIQVKLASDLFLRLIRMIVVAIVRRVSLCRLAHGMAGATTRA
jgi:proton glutamate symport protein